MDVRVVYYTKGEDRMKLIEKLQTPPRNGKRACRFSTKLANYYLLGMANSNRVDPKNPECYL